MLTLITDVCCSVGLQDCKRYSRNAQVTGPQQTHTRQGHFLWAGTGGSEIWNWIMYKSFVSNTVQQHQRIIFQREGAFLELKVFSLRSNLKSAKNAMEVAAQMHACIWLQTKTNKQTNKCLPNEYEICFYCIIVVSIYEGKNSDIQIKINLKYLETINWFAPLHFYETCCVYRGFVE